MSLVVTMTDKEGRSNVSSKEDKSKDSKRKLTSRKNLSAIIAAILGLLIISFAASVKETPKREAKVYSQAK